MPKTTRTRTQRRDPHDSPAREAGDGEIRATRAAGLPRAFLTSGTPSPMHNVALYASVRCGGLGMPAGHGSIEQHRSPAFSALIEPSQPHPDPHEPPRRQRDIL